MWSFSQTFSSIPFIFFPSPFCWHFSSIKGIMTAHEGFYRKHFQEEEKRLDTGYIVTIKVLGLKIYPFWRKINDVFRFRHYHQAYFLKKDQNQALLKAAHKIIWPSILYQIRYKTLFCLPNKLSNTIDQHCYRL